MILASSDPAPVGTGPKKGGTPLCEIPPGGKESRDYFSMGYPALSRAAMCPERTAAAQIMTTGVLLSWVRFLSGVHPAAGLIALGCVRTLRGLRRNHERLRG